MSNSLIATVPQSGWKGGKLPSNRVMSFNHDGLELARVKQSRRYFPVWHFALLVYLVLFLRLVIFTDIGSAAYNAKMTMLSEGAMVDRVAAAIMSLDPVSQKAAIRLRALVRRLDGGAL